MSEEVEVEHREWRRDCGQGLDSSILNANGQSEGGTSRIASKPDSVRVHSIGQAYEGEGRFNVCLFTYAVTEFSLAAAYSAEVKPE